MKTDNTVPLYKRLNEERTQGEWKLPEQEKEMNEYSIITDNMNIATFPAIDIDDEEGFSNTAYTALAVNNLHLLAEALETIQSTLNGWNKDGKYTNLIEYSKTVLNRIS